ncbi:MAG: hypothetical protein Q4C54_10585 [Clostridia bacterium]|nr:hypothetical protein [Clostridia bacterium]
MYRYSNNRPMGSTGEPRLKERIKTVVIILLLAALVVLGTVSIPGMRYKQEANELFVHRIQVECGEALNYSTGLSRTAGASTSSILANIRSRVYAMETINALSVGMDGAAGYIIQEEWFRTLYDILDQYNNRIVTGMTTGDQATSLQNSLQMLYNQLEQL